MFIILPLLNQLHRINHLNSLPLYHFTLRTRRSGFVQLFKKSIVSWFLFFLSLRLVICIRFIKPSNLFIYKGIDVIARLVLFYWDFLFLELWMLMYLWVLPLNLSSFFVYDFHLLRTLVAVGSLRKNVLMLIIVWRTHRHIKCFIYFFILLG